MFRSLGAHDALEAFGVKVAGGWSDYAEEVQRQGIGDPQKALSQFRKGTLFAPNKGLLYQGLPRTPGQVAAALAFPLLGSFLTARANPELGAGEVTGDFLGRSMGSMVGAPLLGAVGQIGGGMLTAPVGRAVGKALDPKSTDVAPEE